MRSRRSVVLLIGLFIFGGLAALFWGARPKPDADVALLFVGFTNTSVRAGEVPAAILLATNTGRVPVELQFLMNASFRNRRSTRPLPFTFESPAGRQFPLILKSGEGLRLHVCSQYGRGPWWPELWYQRYGIRERLVRRTLKFRNLFVQPRLKSLFGQMGACLQMAPLKQTETNDQPSP